MSDNESPSGRKAREDNFAAFGAKKPETAPPPSFEEAMAAGEEYHWKHDPAWRARRLREEREEREERRAEAEERRAWGEEEEWENARRREAEAENGKDPLATNEEEASMKDDKTPAEEPEAADEARETAEAEDLREEDAERMTDEEGIDELAAEDGADADADGGEEEDEEDAFAEEEAGTDEEGDEEEDDGFFESRTRRDEDEDAGDADGDEDAFEPLEGERPRKKKPAGKKDFRAPRDDERPRKSFGKKPFRALRDYLRVTLDGGILSIKHVHMVKGFAKVLEHAVRYVVHSGMERLGCVPLKHGHAAECAHGSASHSLAVERSRNVRHRMAGDPDPLHRRTGIRLRRPRVSDAPQTGRSV